ncbi:Ig-like domain-containing protein [uncultured Shewanella sp.]|uniref:Ig-like domain-containing protein n=1 Tax=uncultured Shewanella sp. TaxID=173975 RepID=UPI00260194A0|nr:Ig-like domain-containing protein [uncultured Shewanella sp.]
MNLFITKFDAVIHPLSGSLKIKTINDQVKYINAETNIHVGDQVIFNRESEFFLTFENQESLTSDNIKALFDKDMPSTSLDHDSQITATTEPSAHDIRSDFIQIIRTAKETLAESGYDSAALPLSNNNIDKNNPFSSLSLEGEQLEQELPTLSITLNNITDNNILNILDVSGNILISGNVFGHFQNGNTVTVNIANNQHYTHLNEQGYFSLNIPGNELALVTQVTAQITTQYEKETLFAHTEKDYTVELVGPDLQLTLNDVTEDNIINSQEAHSLINITGQVFGDFNLNDQVNLTINNQTYTTHILLESGYFNTNIQGHDLANDSQIYATVSTTDQAGNNTIAHTTKAYTVSVNEPNISISLNPITGDNILSSSEVTDMVTLTGTVSGEYNSNDQVIISVNNLHHATNIDPQGYFSLRLHGSELSHDKEVTASITSTDNVGNQTTKMAVQPYTLSAFYDLEIDPIAEDGIINAQEYGSIIAITGRLITSDPFPLENTQPITVEMNLGVNDPLFRATIDPNNGEFIFNIEGEYFSALPNIQFQTEIIKDIGNNIVLTANGHYTLDRTPPEITLSLNPIGNDNVLNAALYNEDIRLSGTVSGEYNLQDQVKITHNGQVYTTHIDDNGHFSISLNYAELSQDTQLYAEISSTDLAGNQSTVYDSLIFVIDPLYNLVFDDITGDNIINNTEVQGELAVSGTLQDLRTNTPVVQQNILLTVITDKFPEGISTLAITDENGFFTRSLDASDFMGHSDISITATATISDDTTHTDYTFTETKDIYLDLIGPALAITLNPITPDNIISPAESLQSVQISGVVSGDYDPSTPVTINVNGQDYLAQIDASGHFSTLVISEHITQGTQISAYLSHSDPAGNITEAIDTLNYTLAPMYSLTLDNITDDNVINRQELNNDFIISGRIEGVDVIPLTENNLIDITLNIENNPIVFTGLIDPITGAFHVDINGTILAGYDEISFIAQVSLSTLNGDTYSLSSTKSFLIDNHPPVVTLVLHPITEDNHLSLSEANNDIIVTGHVEGEYQLDDQVIITVNGLQYIASLNNEGLFNVSITSQELRSDNRITATLTTTDNAGNTTSVAHHQDYSVEFLSITPADPTDLIVDNLNPITVDPIDHSDDLIVDTLNPITVDPIDHSNDLIVDNLNPITIDPIDHSNDLIVDNLNPITVDPIDHSNDLIVDTINIPENEITPIPWPGDETLNAQISTNSNINNNFTPIEAEAITASAVSLNITPVTPLSDTTESIVEQNDPDLIDTIDFSGNDGVDIFVLNAAAMGETHIIGFDLDKDKLDLSDILQEDDDVNNLDNLLHFSTEDGDTIIDIDSNHDGDMNQHLILDGVNLFSSYSVNNDSDMINTLIAEDNLIFQNSSPVNTNEPEPLEEGITTFTA